MQTLNYKDKTIHIISTAHVSKESVIEVKEAIDTLLPEVVCIELDDKRADALTNPKTEDLDIKQIIKDKKVGFFVSNLILSNYQKQIAEDLDTQVGAEMIQAIESANEHSIPLRYIDRDIQVTLKRIWNPLSLWKKANLGVTLVSSLFESEDVDAETIESLKESDLLMSAIQELDESYPEISQVILHERNSFMAEKIKALPYNNIVVVIGAAHAPGMIEALDVETDLSELSTIPNKKGNKWTGFILPGILILFITIVTLKSPEMGVGQLISWILTSSTLASIGALLSLAHPVTIVVTFATTWIGILSPVLAVGFFSALTEAYFRPPLSSQFASLSEDVKSFKGWYRNRVLRIVLVFFLTSIMSSIGTLISTKNIIQSLLNIFK